MAAATSTPPSPASLNDPAFKQRLQFLRQTDNYRNWFYLFRTYALLALVVGGTVSFYHFTRAGGTLLLWNLPVVFLAVMLVGALQHHLASLAHEAVHHTLFKNRYLNDLVSELCCSFPMFSSTFHYGLHHLAHHQFVNDPIRDPDISQLQQSGHRLSFPIVRDEFLDVLFRQMWVPNLVRYSMARTEYDSLGSVHNPYIREDWQYTKLPQRLSGIFLGAIMLSIGALVYFDRPLLLAIVPFVAWAAFMVVMRALPERSFYQSKIRPLFSMRTLAMIRVTFLSTALCGVAWATWVTGDWWGAYLVALWVVPLLTAFPLYMVLRQIVQHGNGDRGWLTNSRVFLCHPFINFAVFPLGQDYHLPHHMFSTIPHYRLRELHELMAEIPEYRDQATVVEGYFWPTHQPQTLPTVVDVLGPEYAPHEFRGVYIDNSVLEGRNVSDVEKRQIMDDGAREAARVQAEARVGSWAINNRPAHGRRSDAA